jgi:hypothetical protein
MSYETALEAAGAVVHDFQSFGSYQGDWLAKVTYQGVTGFVRGSYGSCSGCDSFEAEFGYHQEGCDDHSWKSEPGCSACQIVHDKYQRKLALFGEGYLDYIVSHEELVYEFAAQAAWDYDAREILDWLAQHQEVK